MTLGVTNGTLTLSGLVGLSFTVGDGTADASLEFTGTLADVNAAINGMSYAPTTAFEGSSTLTIATNDQGNTGSGGAQIDTDTVAIIVDDAPTVTAATPANGAIKQATNTDVTVTFSEPVAVGGTAFGIS